MKAIVKGRSGRLGRVVAETLQERQYEIVTEGDTNYLVIAHRYRGAPDFAAEMFANVEKTVTWVNEQTWASGDTAITIVSSIASTVPALNETLAYNLSKACQDQMARFYAGMFRINTVNPATFTGSCPQVTIQEVANVIAFLCSPQSSGLSGQNIRVGGSSIFPRAR